MKVLDWEYTEKTVERCAQASAPDQSSDQPNQPELRL